MVYQSVAERWMTSAGAWTDDKTGMTSMSRNTRWSDAWDLGLPQSRSKRL